MAGDPDITSFLAGQVSRADPERYLSSLYAPAGQRPALLALYAFDAEIAHIRDVVREPMAGEIRLQWWRDVLAGGRRDEAAGNPLAAALIEAANRHGLPRDALDRYLQARRFDLYDEVFPDRNALEGYCGETAGTIFQLAVLVLEPDAARHAGEAAGHAACAWTVAGWLGSAAAHRARGRCFVPADILANSGTTRDAYLGGTDKAGAKAVLEWMTALGREHLGRFEQAARGLPKALTPAFLPLAPVAARLNRVERAGTTALERRVDITPVRRSWLIMWRALRGFR